MKLYGAIDLHSNNNVTVLISSYSLSPEGGQ
jgi:hypothetical protein